MKYIIFSCLFDCYPLFDYKLITKKGARLEESRTPENKSNRDGISLPRTR